MTDIELLSSVTQENCSQWAKMKSAPRADLGFPRFITAAANNPLVPGGEGSIVHVSVFRCR